ncbi:hypothetical protein GCM10008932_18360 [Alkalibacterium iburiense]|uniref:DUF1697 domain-containing protein n=1 Tax=Alkalibacterium iburiense TaxID=290589 RepID=A0ABN0XKR6_9LACT
MALLRGINVGGKNKFSMAALKNAFKAESKNVSKSGLSKRVGTEIYKKMTIRNVHTVRKIYLLMMELKDSLL